MTKAQGFGLTHKGFKAKDFSTIKSELEADLRKEVDPTLQFGAGSVAGMLTAIVAHQLRQVWEVTNGLYHSLQPSAATGRALDELCSLTGTYRRLATYSKIKATVTLAVGVTVPKGSRIETLLGQSFVTTADVKNKSFDHSEKEADLVAEKPGAIIAHQGSTAKIMTPIAGWSKVVIKHTYEVGRLDECDHELRLRRFRELKATGSSTLSALRASLMKVDLVEAVHIKEGVRDFQAIVKGGSDSDVAHAIWRSKPLGVETTGAVSFTITDSLGQQRIIRFSRPEIIPFTMDLNLKTKHLLEQGELDNIKNALALFAQKQFSLGKEVYSSRFYHVVLKQPKVLDIVYLRLKRASGQFSNEIGAHLWWLAMLEIPITSDVPHFSQEHHLFGRLYVFEFEWVEREGYWVLHLHDGSEAPIVLGLKLSLDWPIWFDRTSNVVLWLIPKHSQVSLGLKTLQRDFSLVAYENV